MKRIVMTLTALAMLLAACSSVPLTAQDEFSPRLAIEVGGMYALIRPSVIGEFDRSRWQTGVQIHVPISQVLSVNAGYGFGGIIYGSSGHTLAHGPMAGVRYTVLQDTGHWMDGLYVSGGVNMEWIGAHRVSPVISSGLSLGYPLVFSRRYAMINELTSAAAFGESIQVHLGFRNSMRMTW